MKGKAAVEECTLFHERVSSKQLRDSVKPSSHMSSEQEVARVVDQLSHPAMSSLRRD